ncbi:MAG TPA: T9SS type A sorting domain-containing protein [Puia sp.]|nr:T9SS type A sorting domain-containing protein [Puia sp.]
MLRSAVAVAGNNTALASGLWETGTNWSTGAAPTATDNVIIPAGITITVTAVGDVCASVNVALLGALHINSNMSLSVGGNFTNAGSFLAQGGSTLTFNGAANSVISGGGTYTVAATVVMNMGSTATTLDVQDANFITGINSSGKYYFTFTRGTWKMDNTGTLGDAYNSGSTTALTIPYGVVIESDAGTMNLAKKGTTNNVLLSGELFINGGIVNVQIGQSTNSGQDFRYTVNGGTPQLYVSSGTLNIGAGFNAVNNTDYIDFHMTGGTIVTARNGYSKWITFQLADNVGGKTFMSAGLIILQDACNANIEDLDMGGANVAASLYSVTGGTVQLGYVSTQAGASFFGIMPEPATNYPNIDFEAGVAKNVSAYKNGNINMLSLHVNSNMTFDASGFPVVNIMSNNGTFAFDDEGGFVESTNTVTFSGSVPQVISSSSLASESFYNLNIANTSGHVILSVPTTVANKLSFTSGLLDASADPITISNGAVAVTGGSATSYVIVGNGVSTTGYMKISSLPTSTSTFFPIGTSSYYLPFSVNPGTNTGNAYTAYVFTGATTNAQSNGPAISASVLAHMLNAVWNVARTAGSGTASLTLDWNAPAVPLQGSIFSTAGTSIGIAQYTTTWGWAPATGSGNVATQFATSSFSNFTQFSAVDNLFVLPVVLYDFNAELRNNKTVQLSWSASDEAQISNFEVQRSTDGVNFSPIGTLQASVAETSYSLVDANPANGVNYYRLISHNNDGGSVYSAIKAVNLFRVTGISVFPVPATTTLNVSVGDAGTGVSVRLISQTGQVLQSLTAAGGSQVISMNISGYPAGAYFVQVIGQNSVLQTTPVTKL